MERKSTKTRLKHASIVSATLKKLFFVQILIFILRSVHCSNSIRDYSNSSNLIYNNLSLSLNHPTDDMGERLRWRHANRRKISLESFNHSNRRKFYPFNTDIDLHSNRRHSLILNESGVVRSSSRHLETFDSSAGSSIFTSDKRHKSAILRDIKFLRKNLNKRTANFMMTDELVDGEVEKRIIFNGITAKETSVGVNRTGLKLRQLTDGRHLVQIIYTPNGDIYDCEYVTQKKSVRSFLRTARSELKQALQEENQRLFENTRSDHQYKENEAFIYRFQNVTFRILHHQDGDPLPADIDWLEYDDLRAQCLDKHREMKELLEMRENVNKVSKVEAENSLTRHRRSFRENFIIPGTKWCGAGQLASRYGELGIEKKEDKCCRAHDTCSMNILPFRRKYGVFNARLYTVSHCRCDRRFRACLKLADTSVSNMVGKLFFNIVQTKCFVLKPSKVCVQRSWWGKCLKRGYTKQAHLRNNLPY